MMAAGESWQRAKQKVEQGKRGATHTRARNLAAFLALSLLLPPSLSHSLAL
jgi:hypothetical protein